MSKLRGEVGVASCGKDRVVNASVSEGNDLAGGVVKEQNQEFEEAGALT